MYRVVKHSTDMTHPEGCAQDLKDLEVSAVTDTRRNNIPHANAREVFNGQVSRAVRKPMQTGRPDYLGIYKREIDQTTSQVGSEVCSFLVNSI